MKTILVVEPDQNLGQFMSFVLEQEGYKVTAVQSIEEATALLPNSRFDLIISGELEQKDLWDFDPSFLAKLKALAGETPVILYSYSPFQAVAKARGIADIVEKPSDITELIAKVNKALGKSPSDLHQD